MTTTITSPAVDGFLADVLHGSMSPTHHAPQAVLDAIVPGWRLTAEGADAIAQEYGRWPADLLAEMDQTRHAH